MARRGAKPANFCMEGVLADLGCRPGHNAGFIFKTSKPRAPTRENVTNKWYHIQPLRAHTSRPHHKQGRGGEGPHSRPILKRTNVLARVPNGPEQMPLFTRASATKQASKIQGSMDTAEEQTRLVCRCHLGKGNLPPCPRRKHEAGIRQAAIPQCPRTFPMGPYYGPLAS